MSRSSSSPMSSSRAESRSGMACCSASMSQAIISCLRSSIWPRRKWSKARRLAVVTAADRVCRPLASRAGMGERANLARPFPTREEVLVQLHELRRRRHRLFLALQLEGGIAANDLLGLHERAVDDAELPFRD